VGANGPIPNAIVQVQGTPNKTTTQPNGTFTLHGTGLGGNSAVTITAWADGHTIGWVVLDPAKPNWQDLQIRVLPHFAQDNAAYTWFTHEGIKGSAACGACHREYSEWQADSHSKSASNPRFINVYRGTNAQGQKNQPTRFGGSGVALPADPNLPDYGPGFQLDDAGRPGNCATCHTPLAGKIETTNSCAWSGCHTTTTAERAEAAKVKPNLLGASPVGLLGVAEEGITCEFCHAVRAVNIEPGTGLPYTDQPGIQSMQLLRPPNGGEQKLFFGTLTDSNREQVTYSALQSQSEFCAPCHFGVMGGVVSDMKMVGGVVIYNSYGEWLQSKFSDPQNGKTCQDCHMPKQNTLYTVPPELGGVARDYGAYHDHAMLGKDSQALMWNALTLTSTAQLAGAGAGAGINVQVRVMNDKTGHAVPTDAPIRSVMLVVEALNGSGQPLPLQQGPMLPDWAGNYAGQAGKAFAKVLQDKWTGETPTAAYWRPVSLVADTRILPGAADQSNYTFAAPTGAVATVKVKLVYRRAFQKLAQQKGWNDADFVMAEMVIQVSTK
jgi:hypothetical protein